MGIIRELVIQRIGVIYISHRLDEIFQIADRVLVLRDGTPVGTYRPKDVTRDELIERMVGRKLASEFPRRACRIGEDRFAVRHLVRAGKVYDVSFTARRGEVLGVTGLIGAGRTEMARLIFGADSLDGGSIHLDGKRLSIRGPRDAIKAGICLLTEDRKSQGLVLAHSARENFSLPNLAHWSRFGFMRGRQERRAFGRYIDTLRIKIPYQEQLARNLSGGNQQKLVLAKWLESHAEVILFDEPTRGIDVGAKHEIYGLINELAARGKVIIMISSELPEVLGMADRILVMQAGRIRGEIRDPQAASQEQVMRMAVGS
jgi:ABC-type sugar transport system ATPase subunit